MTDGRVLELALERQTRELVGCPRRRAGLHLTRGERDLTRDRARDLRQIRKRLAASATRKKAQ